VKFQAATVFLWPSEEPLSALPPDSEVHGRLIGFSDSGLEPSVFGLVEVVNTQTIVVRVSDLAVIKTES
jgi:hypothetical protein